MTGPRVWPYANCAEQVTRGGELEPCDVIAVALAQHPIFSRAEPWPVCAHHTRKSTALPLSIVAAFLRESHTT